ELGLTNYLNDTELDFARRPPSPSLLQHIHLPMSVSHDPSTDPSKQSYPTFPPTTVTGATAQSDSDGNTRNMSDVDSLQGGPLLILATLAPPPPLTRAPASQDDGLERIMFIPLHTIHPGDTKNRETWKQIKQSDLFETHLSELSAAPGPGQNANTWASQKENWDRAASSMLQSLTSIVQQVDGEQTRVGVVTSLGCARLPQLLGNGWPEPVQSWLDDMIAGTGGFGSPFTHQLHLDETDVAFLQSALEAASTAPNVGHDSSVLTAEEGTELVIQNTKWRINDTYLSTDRDSSAPKSFFDANAWAWVNSGNSGTNQEEEG
ncbi:hypothetical protein BCR39DRAFT_577545, partial [Naematelia encephala]